MDVRRKPPGRALTLHSAPADRTRSGASLLRVVVGILLLLVLSGCWGTQSTVVRYKLTLVAQVDGQTVSSSVVQEMKVTGVESPMSNENGLSAEAIGQAMIISTSGGREFYVVNREGTGSGSAEFHYLEACGLYPLGIEVSPFEQVQMIAAFRGGCDIPLNRLPMVVAIADPKRPAGITRVAPTSLRLAFRYVRCASKRRMSR